MAILQVESVDKTFPGVRALAGVTIHVEEGEVHGLIGPNGAGKSTLISVVMGVHKPDKGAIRFRGEDISHQSVWTRVQRGLNATQQTALYVADLPVYRHIELGVMVNRFPKTDVAEVGDMVGLRDMFDELPGALSALGAKKLELAKAISTRPTFLMLDECFAGLSFEEGLEVIGIIRRLVEERNVTVLVVDHNLTLVERIAGETTVLDRGSVIAEGDFDAILKDQTVVDAYMG